jgi:hypothetical protein
VPILVATTAEPPGDVFWAGSPRATDLAAFCARRERVERTSIVLVPTSKHVPLDVAARFARGEHVEVRALADWLEVRGGKLAARAPSRGEPETRSESLATVTTLPLARPGIAALLGATCWEEIRFTVVDAHTLRIEAHGKSILRTFVELGFVDGRKKDIVTPTLAWALLVMFCKRKRLKPSAYAEKGRAFGVKKAIERIGSSMREAFGLEQHPIHSYSKSARLWEARFRVADGAGE